jgi:hypothetical protein
MEDAERAQRLARLKAEAEFLQLRTERIHRETQVVLNHILKVRDNRHRLLIKVQHPPNFFSGTARN